MLFVRILSYLCFFISLFSCSRVIRSFLNPKPGKGFLILRVLGISLLVGMIIYIGDLVNSIPTLLIFIIAVCLSYQNSFWQKLSVSFMIASLGLSYAALIDSNLHIEWRSVLRCLFWSLLYIYMKKYGPKSGYHLSDSLWKLLLCLSLTPFGIVTTIVLGLPLSMENSSPDAVHFYNTTVRTISVILLGLVIFSFFALLNSVKVLSRQYQMEANQLLNETKRQYYLNLERHQLEIRKLRHDMIHHLQALTLLKDDARTEYLNNLLEHPSLKYSAAFCENRIVNAVINAKMASVRELGIDFHSRLLLPDEIPMEKPDICAIFANCLDNAIEACEKLSPLLRTISLEARFEKGMFLLRCANPIPDGLTIEGEKFLTSKRDKRRHGLGISIIKEVVERYNGTSEISVSEYEFILLVNIILPQPKGH